MNTPLPANISPNNVAPKVSNITLRNLPFCSFAFILIASLAPLTI